MVKYFYLSGYILFLLFSFSVAASGQDSTKAAESSGFLEIDRLVVDETITKIGRDFYDLFYSYWQAPVGVKEYTIFISEKPLPRIGSQVSIKINDMLVFQQFVRPRYDELENMAKIAVQITTRYLLNYEQIQKDLEGEDMSGSGIF